MHQNAQRPQNFSVRLGFNRQRRTEYGKMSGEGILGHKEIIKAMERKDGEFVATNYGVGIIPSDVLQRGRDIYGFVGSTMIPDRKGKLVCVALYRKDDFAQREEFYDSWEE